MTDVRFTPIYAVNLPNAVRTVFTQHGDVKISLNLLLDFNKLATLLPLEDMFYIIYQQMNNTAFIKFLTDFGLTSVLQLDNNIAWMSSVKTQFDSYIKKQQDLEKINKKEDELLPSKYLHDTHLDVDTIDGDAVALVFHEKTGAQETNITKFKDNIYNAIYGYLGYDALRRHPIMNYIAKLSDIY